MELQEIVEEIRRLEAENTTLREDLMSLHERQSKDVEGLQQKIDRLEETVASLTASIRVLLQVPPITFTVDRFEQLKKSDKEFLSQPFYTQPQGYKMYLKVYPNGLFDGKGQYVSIACHILKGEDDDHLKWPFRGNVHLRLVDQRDHHHRDHFIRYTRHTPSSLGGRVTKGESNQGNNLVQFVAHSELEDGAMDDRFLVDNKLEFAVTKVELR